MKVLIAGLSLNELTGSELYIFEIAKQLSKLGCTVHICASKLGQSLVNLLNQYDIKCFDIHNIPKENYDIIHCQHTPITQFIIDRYPNIPKICSIHSEIISLENPLKHSSIKKYIAIRESIETYLIKEHHINEELITIVYNPIDNKRFYPKKTKDHNAILFAGTVDYLRRETIYNLVNLTKENNRNLWIIGKNQSNYLHEILKHDHVFYNDAVNDIEKYTQSCNETASIMLGRTTIEGWLCDKPGWIYIVDHNGCIQSKSLHQPPNNKDKFYSENVAKQIYEIYKQII